VASAVSAQNVNVNDGDNNTNVIGDCNDNYYVSCNNVGNVNEPATAPAPAVAPAPVVAPAAGIYGCTSIIAYPGVSTITGYVTSTWCPICDQAKSTGGVYTTTYETVYEQVCPTGMSSVTYIVQQTCTGMTTINPSTPPPGFVVTTTVCTACAGAPTVTITQPCNSCPTSAYAYATNKIVVGLPAVVTGVAGSTGGSPGAGGPSSPLPFTGAASSMSSGIFTIAAAVGSVFLGMLLLL